MKRLLISLFCILVCLSAAARNRALLIGIGEYPESSGWERISAANDMRLLSRTLEGYDITVLQDEKATYAGIKNAFAQFTAKCSPGDTVIVHFSCHGQQMVQEKENIQEEQDRLDEALVPFDAQRKLSDSYKGENHLRDDEFGLMIDKLRERVANKGLVIVLLDACHSDTAFRSAEDEESHIIIRGARDIFGADDDSKYDPLKYKKPLVTIQESDHLSDVLYISACKAYQVNRETIQNGIGYGSLTYSFCQVYTETCLQDLSALVAIVKKDMGRIAPAQNVGISANFELQAEPKQAATTVQKEESTLDRLLNRFK
jgi:hypothetical protein